MQSALSVRATALGRVGREYESGVQHFAAPFVQRSRGDSRHRRRRRIGKAFIVHHAAVERSFLRSQRPFWRHVTETVIARFERAGTVAVTVDELFSVPEFRPEFNRSLKPAWSLAVFQGVQFEADWIGHRESQQSLHGLVTQDIGTDPTDLDPPPSFQVELSRDMERRIKSFLQEREVGVWTQVGNTVHGRLERALRRGLKEGDTLDQMQDRIQRVMKGQSDYAARRIARTETTGSMNFGQQIERDEIGIENKEWIATLDGRTRGANPKDRFNHIGADGQTVVNSGLFVVSGQQLAFPGDGSHGASAGNICNCRCVGVSEFGDEIPKAVPNRPIGEAQTVAEAEDMARERDLADVVSYKGLSVETANAFNKSIDSTLRIAPELRDQLRFVGSMQERNKHFVKEWTERELRKYIDRGIAGSDLEHIRKQLTSRARRIVGTASSDTYAQSVKANERYGDLIGGVSINSKWGGRHVAMLKQLENDVAVGWHPVGTANLRSTIDHELGHQLDDLLRLSTRTHVTDSELRQIVGLMTANEVTDALSRYGSTNFRELVAEAWSEYQSSPSPRPLAKQIGKLIEERLKQRAAK